MAEEDDELPFMTIFPSDALAETSDLEVGETGVYFKLRFSMWSKGGSLAFDPSRLARTVGVDAATFDKVWDVIGPFFHQADGRIWHKRDAAEMVRAREQREKRRKGASLTNAQRRAERDAQRGPSDALSASDSGTPPSPSPFPSGSPSTAPEIPPGGAPSDAQELITVFCRMWATKYGTPYLVLDPDSQAVTKLVNAHPLNLDTWERTVDRYLAAEDKFHAERGHPLVDLAKNPNAFRGNSPRTHRARGVGYAPAVDQPRQAGEQRFRRQP